MSVTGSNASHLDFSQGQRFYIVRQTHDDTHVWVQKAMAARGLQAAFGDALDVPAGTTVLVQCSSITKWDMGDWVYKVDVDFLDPVNRRVLASGESMHPSLQRTDPVNMASEAIDKMIHPE